MDIQKEQKNNTDLLREKIDTNLLNGSIEITLLNKLFKNKLINEKIYKQAKESIIKEYKLEKMEIWFYQGTTTKKSIRIMNGYL